jgi:CheY-like chemotaxis protein
VKQVLTFGRGAEGARIPLKPEEVIEDVIRIIRETFPRSIRIRSEVPGGLWSILADSTQMHQVLLNLCVNARDAMPSGGSLDITGENVEIDAIFTRMHPEAKVGTYVMFKIADTGEGIPQAIKDKIFEPFFTTKEVGKGTGLGLSTVHSIVKSHGGFVTLYSEEGEGSSFRIYLPADKSNPARQSESDLRQGPGGDGELVLLVDDEAAIREIALLTLESNGYRVLCANDGAEALAYYERRSGEIAAVITDIMMPNLDGDALIREMAKLNPKVKIIAISGLAESGRMAPRIADGSVTFIAKPFSAKTILEALRGILDAPAA